eukprot:1724298-Rhodomonas_salina.2
MLLPGSDAPTSGPLSPYPAAPPGLGCQGSGLGGSARVWRALGTHIIMTPSLYVSLCVPTGISIHGPVLISGFLSPYAPGTVYPVLTQRTVLPELSTCYGMSGTDLGCRATRSYGPPPQYRTTRRGRMRGLRFPG